MKPESLKCPKCDGPMISRLNKAKYQRFWGCAAYPRCKGTRDTDGNSRAEAIFDREDRLARDAQDEDRRS